MSTQEEIHNKGFKIVNEYGKIKIGNKILEDALLDIDAAQNVKKNYNNKAVVLKALADKDIKTLREISNFFYRTNGIYARVCNYFATMYRYDWCIEAEVYDKKIKNDKLIEDFRKTLRYLDNSNIKKTCGDIALSVIRDGSYYCVAVPGPTGVSLQELLPEYCRSRYTIGAHEAIQFNMKYFDDKFQDVNYRLKVLKLFPEDFQKGYVLYKQGKLPPEFSGDQSGWYLLTPGTAFKFSFDNGEVPMFANAIPAILDLEAA